MKAVPAEFPVLLVCSSALAPHPLSKQLHTVQVAAWDGCLWAMPASDCQAQQAEEQDSWCHGHLQRSGWEGKF